MKIGKRIWSEDDCTTNDPDHETIDKAWQRLFDHPFDHQQATEIEDGGDSFGYRMPNGYVAIAAPDGWCIYEPS